MPIYDWVQRRTVKLDISIRDIIVLLMSFSGITTFPTITLSIRLEKSLHTLGWLFAHLCHYFTFAERSQRDWRNVRPSDLIDFMQWIRTTLPQSGTYPIHAISPLIRRSRNIFVAAKSSFCRYQFLRGKPPNNTILHEQISNLFRGFKRFLFHTRFGKTTWRSNTLIKPRRRVKTEEVVDFETSLERTISKTTTVVRHHMTWYHEG